MIAFRKAGNGMIVARRLEQDAQRDPDREGRSLRRLVGHGHGAREAERTADDRLARGTSVSIRHSRAAVEAEFVDGVGFGGRDRGQQRAGQHQVEDKRVSRDKRSPSSYRPDPCCNHLEPQSLLARLRGNRKPREVIKAAMLSLVF